jgi:hypothetical protein
MSPGMRRVAGKNQLAKEMAHHVVEIGGAATLARSFGAIRVGGKISMIGGLGGPATELRAFAYLHE